MPTFYYPLFTLLSEWIKTHLTCWKSKQQIEIFAKDSLIKVDIATFESAVAFEVYKIFPRLLQKCTWKYQTCLEENFPISAFRWYHNLTGSVLQWLNIRVLSWRIKCPYLETLVLVLLLALVCCQFNLSQSRLLTKMYLLNEIIKVNKNNSHQMMEQISIRCGLAENWDLKQSLPVRVNSQNELILRMIA